MAKVNRYTLTSLPHPLHGELDDIKGRSMFIDMNEDQAGYSNLNNTEPQRHEYHEIIWLSHGTAVHFLDGERRELPTNTLVSIPKGSIHNLCPSPDCRISRIRFRQEFLKSDVTLIFAKRNGSSVIQTTGEQAAIIESYLVILSYEYAKNDPFSRNQLQYLLAAFILKIDELRQLLPVVTPKSFTQYQFVWNRFNNFLEEKFKTEHRVSYYCSMIGLSRRKLGEIAIFYSGKYVCELINERLIIEARRMILSSDLSIKEIAYELGVDDQSYFSKVFKKLTGLTPIDFKTADADAQLNKPDTTAPLWLSLEDREALCLEVPVPEKKMQQFADAGYSTFSS